MGNRREQLGQPHTKNMKKIEIRCTACGKLLAKGQGEIEIKCTRCKTMNILKTKSFNVEGLGASFMERPHGHQEDFNKQAACTPSAAS